MRLVLHIGTHKTATTSTQTVFKRSRDEMRKHGIAYPSPRLVGRNDTAGHHFFPALIVSGKPDELDLARTFVERAVEAHPECHTLLISCEGFYRYVMPKTPEYPGDTWQRHDDFVARSAALFEGFDPEIWISLRRIDSFALSLYQERIKKSEYTGTIDTFSDPSNMLLDYGPNIALFEKHFGTVRPFIFEEDVRSAGGVTAAFLRRLDLPASYADILDKPMNVSLHPHLVEFKRRLNGLTTDREDRARITDALIAFQQDSGDPLLSQRFSLLSEDARQALRDRVDFSGCASISNEDLTRLKQTWWKPDEAEGEQPARYPGLSDVDLIRIAASSPVLANLVCRSLSSPAELR